MLHLRIEWGFDETLLAKQALSSRPIASFLSFGKTEKMGRCHTISFWGSISETQQLPLPTGMSYCCDMSLWCEEISEGPQPVLLYQPSICLNPSPFPKQHTCVLPPFRWCCQLIILSVEYVLWWEAGPSMGRVVFLRKCPLYFIFRGLLPDQQAPSKWS